MPIINNQVIASTAPSGGRPTKVIDPAWLQEATKNGRHITITKLAELVDMHRNTVRKKLKLTSTYTRFSDISDSQLDDIVRFFQRRRPDSGMSYIMAFLRQRGLRIQRSRVRKAYHRVNALGIALRRSKKIHRRQYISPRPNFCWHVDGYHKLIRWGFVVHGFIDGYCRTVRIPTTHSTSR